MDFKKNCCAVKTASYELSLLQTDIKNEILMQFAKEIQTNAAELEKANMKDIEFASQNGMKEAFIDRLTLTDARIDTMVKGILDIKEFKDPIGELLEERTLECGLHLRKVRVPLGVVGIIYESRPNVTADSIAICIKSGNACVLRGGKEAINSNKAIADIMRNVLRKMGLNENFVYLVEDATRESTSEMMKMKEYIDVIIPRGGKGLIDFVVNNSVVPVIETGSGNCHIYIDSSADTNMAVSVTTNAKVSRPSVCNSAETLLVHKDIAKKILPAIKDEFIKHDVAIHGCEKTAVILGSGVVPATEYDWETEYNELIMAVKVVDGIDEAIEHIQKYSTHHSDAIITNIKARADKFTKQVDSAAVYVNASTRFTDGAVFGLGAEIGISTQKLHARGPMGIKELTSYKYILNGNGEIR